MDIFKRLDHGSSHPTKPLRALVGVPTARDVAAFGWKEASRISMDGTDFGIDSNSDVGIM